MHYVAPLFRFDLLVTETLDAALFGEGILKTLKDAHERLLSETSSVIPARVEAFAALIECDSVCRYTKLKNKQHWPFKSLPVGDLKEPYTTERLEHLNHKLLSQWQKVLEINFGSLQDINWCLERGKDRELSVDCSADGRVDAIALSFKLFVDAENSLNTFPGSNSCWENAIYPVCGDLYVGVGSEIPVKLFVDDVLHLSVMENKSGQPVHFPLNSMTAINSECFQRFFTGAAESICPSLKNLRSVQVLDTSPFPFGALALGNRLPNVAVTVADEAVAEGLRRCGVAVVSQISPDQKFDVIFCWPFSGLGILQEDFESSINFWWVKFLIAVFY